MKKFWLLPLVLAALVFSCSTDTNSEEPENPDDTRTALTAGAAVTVVASATTADARFTGASGLTLDASHFTVTTGATITNVVVTGNAVAVTITFEPNASGTEAKTYTVGIASDSTVIMGTATVTVTQAARPALTAGSAVTAESGDTSAEVEFTGASGLTLETSDFTVTTGATITDVSVSGPTVTVTVTFAANTSPTEDKTYTVGIAPDSTVIIGTATVTITHYRIVLREVSGIVKSAGDPVAGATVTISKDDVEIDETTTDADGAFTFSEVPAGIGYTVTASKDGYESMPYTYDVPRSGDPEPLQFNLISQTHVYYDEPFDMGSLDNWGIMKDSEDDIIEIVVDPDDSGNTLLHINKTTSGTSNTRLGIYNETNAGAYGIFTIETRIKRSVSDDTVNGNQMHIYTYDAANSFENGNGANSVANFVTNLGKMGSHNASGTASYFTTYDADTWYKITMRVDTATKRFSIYVDGEMEVENWGFRTTTNVNKIDIFNIAAGNTGSVPGELWVDYIKVYQGEPQFD